MFEAYWIIFSYSPKAPQTFKLNWLAPIYWFRISIWFASEAVFVRIYKEKLTCRSN